MTYKEVETSPTPCGWILVQLVLESSFLTPSFVLLSKLTGTVAEVVGRVGEQAKSPGHRQRLVISSTLLK